MLLLLETLERFLVARAGARPGDGIVVAFSGGADSTALLHGLARLAPELGLRLVAAHLDHALDPGSGGRAIAAAAAAERLGVPCHVERRQVDGGRRGGAGVEAEARRVRYAYLEEVRCAQGCRWIATAHHRDDQAETVLLRARFGSGPLGLGGIQPMRGPLLRPLLAVGRADLRRALESAGLDWIEDPTNLDGARPRNGVRRLLAAAPGVTGAAAETIRLLPSIADRARGARGSVDRALARALDARREFDGASVEFEALRRLPRMLVSPALAMLHRRAGLAYPASRRAMSEIERQMDRGETPRCDCGPGWGWAVRGSRLHLARRSSREPTPVLFTYTLDLPGGVEVKELSLHFRVLETPDLPSTYAVSPRRAVLALPLERGTRLTVRNRRPGDRIRPLGWNTSCRVKDLLINRKVPRSDRSRLPLLASGEDVLWIPGVTIDDRLRPAPGVRAWVAEIHDAPGAAVRRGADPSVVAPDSDRRTRD
jgi:tRNA(Ile)-lysidine synthase